MYIPFMVEDIEIGDVESYSSNKDTGFSHQALVMKAMNRTIDCASKEMKAGWFTTKLDKQGNQVRVYEEDTRLVFISCVETCLMVMDCDLDPDAKDQLKDLIKKRDDLKEFLIKQEDKEWESLMPMIRQKLASQGKGNIKGYLDKDKRFYQIYLEECIKIYREIFKVLTNQTKRLDYYVSEGWEA
jgi:hypothetical protein